MAGRSGPPSTRASVRAWALAIPLALAVVAWLPVEGTVAGDPTYRRFWNDVGEKFPVLTGAASTEYYFANENGC